MLSISLCLAAATVLAGLPAVAQVDTMSEPEASAAPEGVVPLDAWYPQPVESRQPPFFEGGAYTRSGYVPLERAERLWDICVSLPPRSFAYFDVLARGLEAEGRRQGVLLRIRELDGFAIEDQWAQLEQCLEEEADALIVVAIAKRGFDEIFLQARRQGVPVIDLTTGSGSRNVTARIVTDRIAVGQAAGRFLADRHPHGSGTARVVWLSGPPGSQIVADEDFGLRAGIANGALEIVRAMEIELEEEPVRAVVRDILDEGLAFDALVGGSLTVQIASQEIAGRFPPGAVELISVTAVPSTVSGIVADQVFAAVNDRPVIQARIAVDLAVRAIEDRPFLRDLRPALEMIDRSNVEVFDRSTVLPPS